MLETARQRGRDPTALRPALDRLAEEARVALRNRVNSVMDKPITPPSGDKHDYCSQAPYWWPAPDSADGRPYQRRDGLINPEALKLDKYALLECMRDVETLALAWLFFGSLTDARRAAERLRAWFLDPTTRMNPHLEFGQAIPGVCTGGPYGIIDANKLCPLPDLLEILRSSGALTANEETEIRQWLAEFTRWLAKSKHGREEASFSNNHGTWCDVLGATLFLATGQPENAKGILRAAAEKRIARQIEPDGQQPHEQQRTRSYFYACYNLTAMFELATLGEHCGLDLWHWRDDAGRGGIQAGINFLGAFADEKNAWPHQEIVPDGRHWVWPLLRRASLVYGDQPKYAKILNRLPAAAAERYQLLWPDPRA